MTEFPNNFLIGGAISSSQAEGAFDADGRGLETQDLRYFDSEWTREERDANRNINQTHERFRTALTTSDITHYPLRHGIDFYHRYTEDIDLLAESGLQIFRTSISWGRIFPNGDEDSPNALGIKFYRDLFTRCHQRGMKVFVTILHYSVPVHLIEKFGGWQSREMIDCYVKFAQALFENLGDLVDYWLPFNEINAARFNPYNGVGVIRDQFTDNKQYLNACFQALHHQFVANAKTIALGHRLMPDSKFGGMIARFTTYPATSRPEDVLQATQEEDEKNYFYTDVLARGIYPAYMKKYFVRHDIHVEITPVDRELIKANTVDFLSFSYYMSMITTTDPSDFTATSGNLVSGLKNPYLETSDWGWQIDPIGLRTSLNAMYDRYQLPLFVAENGIGAHDELVDGKVADTYRIAYLRAHLLQIQRAIVDDGVPVFGYTIWGIIDIVSCGTLEMSKRYGIVYVDLDDAGRGTAKRYKKDSFTWLKKTIADRGQMLERGEADV